MDHQIVSWNKASILEVLQDPHGRSCYRSRWYYNGGIVYRFLQALYARQTSFEQDAKCTVESNGIGFNGYDSGILSDIAERSKSYRGLSARQTDIVAKRLIKYAGQLENIALEKIQQSLPICGYCSEIGHTQQDCPKYKALEMGQQELFGVGKYPD